MKNTLIVKPKTIEQLEALKTFLSAFKIDFSLSNKEEEISVAKEDKSPYNPEFVAKILKSQEERKAGKGKVVTIEELEAKLCK